MLSSLKSSGTTMRLRLKADGRIVRVLSDGSERPLINSLRAITGQNGQERRGTANADYVRDLRRRAHLTQAQFAATIGVSLDTVRNWEQGKRSPRGPARALLNLIENALGGRPCGAA